MKIRGSQLVVKALEDEGVRFTFGIPGTHNTELYDALHDSSVTPVLVTDEQCASFMADGVSRTSDTIGVVNVVPGAGVTHCLSGVAEALLDNVPLLVLACGIRNDLSFGFQLHDIDQASLLKPVTKAFFRPETPQDCYRVVREAIRLARAGTPGPVAVEVPANFYLLTHDIPDSAFVIGKEALPSSPDPALVKQAAVLLRESRSPLLYVGQGALQARDLILALVDRFQMPVATTISGKGLFPEDHPCWLWNGLGRQAPPFVAKLTEECDVMLAVGLRFGEVATGSYGLEPPENLIHVDINPDVIGKNFKPAVGVCSDAKEFFKALLADLPSRPAVPGLAEKIAQGHREVEKNYERRPSRDRVTPHLFFKHLQEIAGPQAIYVTDSGNGTFLSMEHLRLKHPRCFLGPIDYSCMGYAVPSAVGAKMANPQKTVVALAGDGALLMTGLEMITASSYGAAPLVIVLRDGELGQIAQFQQIPLNRKTCTVLPDYSVEDYARFVGAEFLKIARDRDLHLAFSETFRLLNHGRSVVMEVDIDYTLKTYFTKGVVTSNFWRFPWSERLRILTRAVSRRLIS